MTTFVSIRIASLLFDQFDLSSPIEITYLWYHLIIARFYSHIRRMNLLYVTRRLHTVKWEYFSGRKRKSSWSQSLFPWFVWSVNKRQYTPRFERNGKCKQGPKRHNKLMRFFLFFSANGFYNETVNKIRLRGMEGLVNWEVSLNCARRSHSPIEYPIPFTTLLWYHSHLSTFYFPGSRIPESTLRMRWNPSIVLVYTV